MSKTATAQVDLEGLDDVARLPSPVMTEIDTIRILDDIFVRLAEAAVSSSSTIGEASADASSALA